MLNCCFKKSYFSKKNTFVLDVNCQIQLHKFNVVFGSSGAGKTSLLRIISGLETMDSGVITCDQFSWTDRTTPNFIPPNFRNISFVQQEHNLFLNMSVMKNIQFANQNYDPDFLKEMTSVFEISSFMSKKPNQLSKGQQQRVALTCALIQEPSFLMLDETLSALDQTLRKRVGSYLKQIQQKRKFTVIMISHELEEVLSVADHIVVLDQGRVKNQGPIDILISDKQPFLKGLVVQKNKDTTTVLIGHQKVEVSNSKLHQKNYEIGDEITLSLT